jgi:hypothetical protein
MEHPGQLIIPLEGRSPQADELLTTEAARSRGLVVSIESAGARRRLVPRTDP